MTFTQHYTDSHIDWKGYKYNCRLDYGLIGKVINTTVDWIMDSEIDLNDIDTISNYIKNLEL